MDSVGGSQSWWGRWGPSALYSKGLKNKKVHVTVLALITAASIVLMVVPAELIGAPPPVGTEVDLETTFGTLVGYSFV